MEKKTVEYYDLHDLLRRMENLGHLPQHNVWNGYIMNWGVTNDTIFWLGFDYYKSTPKLEPVYKKYFTAVNEMLGFPPENDGIWVRASW